MLENKTRVLRYMLEDAYDHFVNVLRFVVEKHDKKYHGKPVFMCTNIEVRNRARREDRRIPADKPQCPIYKDNRCCGGCILASTCPHIVNCGCYGMTYGAMGGTEERYYLTPASKYYGYGSIKNGKFDWDQYKHAMRRKDIAVGKALYTNDNHILEIRSRADTDGYFTVYDLMDETERKCNIDDTAFQTNGYLDIYKNAEACRLLHTKLDA